MFKRDHISGLLLIAFLAWLFHSVVPHHHHGTEICFNHQHCHEQECSDGITPDGTCHNHDHDGDHDVCLLKQITFLPVYPNKLLTYTVKVTHCKSEQPLAIPDQKDIGYGILRITGKQTPDNPPYVYSRFITTAGLRAPPRV